MVGAIRNVRITNLTATECRPRQAGVIDPSIIAGLPEQPVENITLEHVRIVAKGGGTIGKPVEVESTRARRGAAASSGGFFIQHAKGINLKDVTLMYERPEPRPSLVANDVFDLQLDDFKPQKFSGTEVMRLSKIDKLFVRHSAALTDRISEHVDALKE
jgi:hypothetical protein